MEKFINTKGRNFNQQNYDIVLELEFLICTVNTISILQHVEVRGCRKVERFDDRGCTARGRHVKRAIGILQHTDIDDMVISNFLSRVFFPGKAEIIQMYNIRR